MLIVGMVILKMYNEYEMVILNVIDHQINYINLNFSKQNIIIYFILINVQLILQFKKMLLFSQTFLTFLIEFFK